MEHFSYSRLNLYDNCPRSYKLKYLEKREEPPSRPLRIGSAVHETIAAYDKHLVSERVQTDVTWAPRALEEAKKDLANPKRRGGPTKLASDEWAEVEDIFTAFVDSHILDPERVAAIEGMHKISMDGYTFWAMLDLLEISGGAPRITDYKTDRHVRSDAEVKNDFQLGIYAWVIHTLSGYEEAYCQLDFVRYRTTKGVLFDLEAIKKIEKRIFDLIEAIRAEKDWAPTPGSHCSWCPWAEDCAAVSDLPVSIARAEDAERVAGEILVLEKQLKDRKAELSNWTAVEGALVVGGQEFRHFESRSLKPDVEAFIKLMYEGGKDAYAYINVDGRKLKPLLKDDLLRAEIEAISEESVSTSFKHKKAREVE